jgi:hypothetical protein
MNHSVRIAMRASAICREFACTHALQPQHSIALGVPSWHGIAAPLMTAFDCGAASVTAAFAAVMSVVAQLRCSSVRQTLAT